MGFILILSGGLETTSKYLAYIVLDKAYDQYALYGTSLVFIAGSFKTSRKAYYLHKYIHATDPEQKIV